MTTQTIPPRGLPRKEVLARMREMAREDPDWRAGRTWSLVYHAGEEHTRFLREAHGLFFSENGLNPLVFRSLKRFEADVVRMTANLLSGDREVVGTMTSGGTESILLAVKTCRDRARRKRRWLGRPVVIAPESVHVAFEKAAEYFGLRIVHAPLLSDFRVDPRAVSRLVSRHTVLIVGSAPCYPFGVVDPIEDLARIARRHGIPLHVDACLGGFFLPFLEKLGRAVPPFDFRVPGVTSISADVHKYGYAAKGASVLLYRDMDHLQDQFFVYEDWPGGIFVSPALLGTRPGGSIAAAWAALHAIGESGYVDLVRRVMDSTELLLQGIAAIPDLEVIGRPDMSVFGYRARSPAVDIYAVGDELERRGWQVDRLQRPPALHAMVTPAHAASAEAYVTDLRAATAHVKAHPELAGTGGAAMYGLIARFPLRGMIRQNVLKMMRELYGPEGRMPDLDGGRAAASDPLVRLGLQLLPYWERARGVWDRLRGR